MLHSSFADCAAEAEGREADADPGELVGDADNAVDY